MNVMDVIVVGDGDSPTIQLLWGFVFFASGDTCLTRRNGWRIQSSCSGCLSLSSGLVLRPLFQLLLQFWNKLYYTIGKTLSFFFQFRRWYLQRGMSHARKGKIEKIIPSMVIHTLWTLQLSTHSHKEFNRASNCFLFYNIVRHRRVTEKIESWTAEE